MHMCVYKCIRLTIFTYNCQSLETNKISIFCYTLEKLLRNCKLGGVDACGFSYWVNHFFLCRDAAALAQFWVWLEEEIHKDVKLTEVEVADKLLEFRSKQAGFLDTSFDTISGI